MAKRAERCTYGIDVAKNWLDLYCADEDRSERIDNTAVSVTRWLEELDGEIQIALEATNRYHEEVAEQAHALGHRVYVIDAYRLNRYREAVGERAKTDRQDAALLARYLQRERAQLRRWTPQDPREAALRRLLRRRARLVQHTVSLRQSLADMGALEASVEGLVAHCRRLVRQIDRELQVRARRVGWQAHLQRSLSVPGVGPLTSLALVSAFHRHAFRSADAFVAFIGLDVRVRDSGKYKGRRKLTKRGDPELRRLLYNAAMSACRDAYWQPYYQSLRQRGLSGVAALMALARKLVRVCYALLQKQVDFDPTIRNKACTAT